MLHPLIEKHLGHGLLIDTNILLLLLIGRTQRTLVETFKRTSRHGFTGNDFDRLMRVVRRFRHVFTTTSILTEASNLGWQLSGPTRTRFAETLRQTMLSLDEKPMPCREVIDEQHFVKVGLTDAGVFQLARQGLLVLTDDAVLSGLLEKSQFDVINFNHLRLL